MTRKLPFRATLLLWLVLITTAWNLIRVWTAVAWWNVLIEFSTHPAPWVIAMSGMIEALLGIILIYGVWQGRVWAGKFLIGVTAGYSLWYWIERLFWQSPRPNWVFAVILNLILIGFVYYSHKSLAREAHE